MRREEQVGGEEVKAYLRMGRRLREVYFGDCGHVTLALPKVWKPRSEA